MKEEVVLRVCRLCESRASLMKEEVVVKVCRLRKSRASLKKGACHQSLSAARVKGQPAEESVVQKICWLCPLKTSLLE